MKCNLKNLIGSVVYEASPPFRGGVLRCRTYVCKLELVLIVLKGTMPEDGVRSVEKVADESFP